MVRAGGGPSTDATSAGPELPRFLRCCRVQALAGRANPANHLFDSHRAMVGDDFEQHPMRGSGHINDCFIGFQL